MLMTLPSISTLTALTTLYVPMMRYSFFIIPPILLSIVSNNDLMMFPPGYFDHAMSLETLLADHNQLAMLEDDTFTFTPMLTFLSVIL